MTEYDPNAPPERMMGGGGGAVPKGSLVALSTALPLGPAAGGHGQGMGGGGGGGATEQHMADLEMDGMMGDMAMDDGVGGMMMGGGAGAMGGGSPLEPLPLAVAASYFHCPQGMTPNATLKYIFQHYVSTGGTIAGAREKAKGGAEAAEEDEEDENKIDNASFVKMCKQAPGLVSKRLTRSEVDVIFAKNRAPGVRKLGYEAFLDALLEVAMKKYPDEDPVTAFAKLCCRHLFGLIAQDDGFDEEEDEEAALRRRAERGNPVEPLRAELMARLVVPAPEQEKGRRSTRTRGTRGQNGGQPKSSPQSDRAGATTRF